MLETLDDESSLYESHCKNRDVYGCLGEPILCHSEIEAESLLLLDGDLGNKGPVVDGDEDYTYNTLEQGIMIVITMTATAKYRWYNQQSVRDETAQDEVVGEIILFEYKR